MTTVTLYTTDYCGFCRRALALLQAKRATIEQIRVDGNAALRREMEQRSGCHTVPQIWIGDRHIGGCDELYALERSGALDRLLAS